MMTNKKFVEMLELAIDKTTLYVKGAFGAPAGYGSNRTRYTANNAYNKQASRAKKINNCAAGVFFFDCVCLGKGILWGWTADPKKVYGGAKYKSNGVPDFSADAAMTHCTDVSSDFSKLAVGEWLYMPGHIGYYIGDGKVIECTPKWDDGVQYTKLSQRNWTKHGKLKYIEYLPENTDKVTCPKCGHTFNV